MKLPKVKQEVVDAMEGVSQISSCVQNNNPYNPYNIDWEGLIKHLCEINPNCIVCNLHERKANGTRCPHYTGTRKKGCGILNFSSAPNKGEDTRTGPSNLVEQYGISRVKIDKKLFGAHHLYFYIHHRHVVDFHQFLASDKVGILPYIPQIDIEGNHDIKNILLRKVYVKLIGKLKDFSWAIHHINGNHWDNRKENLALVLNTEHGVLHKRTMTSREEAEFIQCIVERNIILFGDPCWGDEVA